MRIQRIALVGTRRDGAQRSSVAMSLNFVTELK